VSEIKPREGFSQKSSYRATPIYPKCALALGATPTTNWNSFTDLGSISAGSVTDLTGATLTGVSIDVASTVADFWEVGTSNWPGLDSKGGSAPDAFVDSVTDDFGGVTGGTLVVTISGLNSSLTYDIYGVTQVNSNPSRQDTLTITGDMTYGPSTILRSTSVSGSFHTFTDVSPDTDGDIVITLSEDVSGFKNPIINGLLINAVPEPSSICLLAAGLLGLLCLRRRK